MSALRTTGRLGASAGSSPGHLLQLIRSHGSWTRQQLLSETGLSRTTLFERLDALFGAGLVYEAGAAQPTGGRPPLLIRFEDRRRVVLVLDLGHHTARVAVTDLEGTSLRDRELPIDIATPPARLLGTVCDAGDELLAAGADGAGLASGADGDGLSDGAGLASGPDGAGMADRADGAGERLVGVGLALPGPVSPTTGRLGPSTIMPGWHTYPTTEEVEARWSVPVLLENDARAHAFGEATARPDVSPLVGVKYGHGIGAGIVLDGHLLCGFDGAAGDIGHIRITSGRGRRCRCGRTGCLAAYASGYAVLRRLRRTSTSLDEVAVLITRRRAVESAVRDAARLLGETLAGLVATVNPQAVVLGGVLGRLPAVVDEIQAQIRARALPRLTGELQITASTARHPAARGMAALVTSHVYAPAVIDATLTGRHGG